MNANLVANKENEGNVSKEFEDPRSNFSHLNESVLMDLNTSHVGEHTKSRVLSSNLKRREPNTAAKKTTTPKKST